MCSRFFFFLLTMQVCDTTMVTPFKIVAKNEERGQPQASYVRYVRVYLPGDTVVEMQKGRRVLVNSIIFVSALTKRNDKKITECVELLADFYGICPHR